MKKTITFLMFLLIAGGIFAQATVQLSMGTNYTNEVYYSFEDGTVKSAERTAWDIAFAQDMRSAVILANTGAGVELYTYSKGAIGDWNTIDTTGMTWTALYNSIETWETGAFNTYTNLNYTSFVFDYGWGVYNMTNHNLVGDSIYIIKLTNGLYKKLAIEKKVATANTWYFKYADLDGSNEVDTSFNVNGYSTSFVYYSLANNQLVDQEPASRWQLLFTKYFDYTYMNGYGYNLTGVLCNDGVHVQKVAGVAMENDDYDASLFSDKISEIGADWKTFDYTTYQYTVADSLVFFVCDSLDGTTDHPVYKVIFTGFAGSSTGNISFTQEKLGTTTGIRALSDTNAGLTIFTNPATDELNITSEENGTLQISLYNLSGKMVLTRSITVNEGDVASVSTESLKPGLHVAAVRSGANLYRSKFIKH